MNAETILALSKWDKSDTVRAKIAPGTYEIDALIRVRGEMVVGKDCPDAKIAAAVPWQKICTVLLGKLNGVTIESVLREALAGGDALDEAAKEVQEKTAAAIEALVESKRGLRRGAVKVVLPVIEEVEVNPVGRIVGAR